jgi:hypothetical protein
VASEGDVVTLVDEAGVERRFRLHDAFDVEGTAHYVVEDVQDPDQVLLLRESDDRLEALEGEEFDRVMALIEAEEPEA